MAYQNVFTGLNDGLVAHIHALIDQLEGLMTYLIKLTPKQRQALVSVGNRRTSFLLKNIRYARRHGNLLPPYRDLANYNRVYYDFNAMQGIQDRLVSLSEAVGDTTKQVGANAMDFALVFYALVETASQTGEPGTETIYKDLAKHFARLSSDDTEQDTTGDNKDGGTTPAPGDSPEGGGVPA